MQGELHPSLRLYIHCFDSAPMPRVYPRGGGPWDQDPVVMRDFRTIRDYELQWKENQEKLDQRSGTTANEIGGALTPEDALNQMLEERGLEEDGYF